MAPHTASDPGNASPPDSGLTPDSRFDDTHAGERRSPLWIGWRPRLLAAAVLAGCLAVFLLIRFMSASPTLDAAWLANGRGQVLLAASEDPALQPFTGRVVVSITARDGEVVAIDDSLLRRTPRWTVDDVARVRLAVVHESLGRALRQGPVALEFEDGSRAQVVPRPRGIAGLGLVFWPLAALALALYMTGVVVWLVRPQLANALFGLVTLCQAGNLLFIALESTQGIPLPDVVVAHDLWLRVVLDVVSAAAILHAFTLHPARLPCRRWIAAGGWAIAAAGLSMGLSAPDGGGWWWWAQGTVIALGVASIATLSWAYRVQPNPFTLMMRRFGFVTVGSLALLTLALAAASGAPGVQHQMADVGSGVWYVFLASLLLFVPFLSRSRHLLREFALLAGISTVATSLDLLFVALFSLGQFASLTLAVFLSLGVYAGARQWILNQLVSSNVLTLERSFEKLYRVAREVEAHPERSEALMLSLLRELFEPLEVQTIQRRASRAQAVADGSALLVPMPRPSGSDRHEADHAPRAWVLRYARRGKRLFTAEDARLADRVAEQLRRAIAYDRAVERGRAEERLRIAQDLHDDIGARLLTLMYKSQNPEMEAYVRHTLQDLKTLTRGLATPEHRLSHAVAEWKADIGQRLTEAQIALEWSFAHDRDIKLSMLQWSGLTRVLRELVSNTIHHARATRVQIGASLEGGRLVLTVSDDGCGRNPQQWSHGLGLGGVRKRVKLLGGTVQWRENGAQGIVCEVYIDELDDRTEARSRPAR